MGKIFDGKRILVLGASSYIGVSFQEYLKKYAKDRLSADSVSLRGDDWKHTDWSVYDSIINVTGRAHADTGTLTPEEKREYYEVNCRLACRAAKKAIADGAGQYIYFSSIIVYGDSSDSRKPVVITRQTKPAPTSFYGDSKWKAEEGLRKLFAGRPARLAILRPPMVYGPGCRGNYRTLEKLAVKLPVFPDYPNRRSMLYIENLCEFLCLLVENQDEGLFFPQNREYVSTSGLVRLIARARGQKIVCTKLLNPAVAAAGVLPGKYGSLVRKAFGSLVYEKGMSVYRGGEYRKYSLEESVAGCSGGR